MTPVRREPLDTPSTWLGPALVESEIVHRLTADEISDLENALSVVRASGKALGELAREDFPLPVLGAAVTDWMRALENGRGFLNVKGLPVDRHSLEDVERMYWGLGLHMGTPVSQNAAGDLLGHVRDTGADPDDTSVRLYKTRVELAFHSDGADLVGLLCIRTGRRGGATRLVSTAAIYNELLQHCPDLVPLLYEPFCWDRNDEQAAGEPGFFQLPICRYTGGRLSFFYIPWYIRKAQRHAEAPRLTGDQHRLLDTIDAIAADPAFHVEMQLEPGEINFLKNNTALHARTAYEDHPDPARKRHLLRLWLTAHGDWADGDDFVRQGIPRKDGVRPDVDGVAPQGATDS